MRRRLVAFVVAAVALGAAGCTGGLGFSTGGPTQAEPLLSPKSAVRKSDESTPEQEAILRVLTDLKTASQTGFDGLKIDAQPTTVTRMAQVVIAHMAKADMAGCPAEFQSAYQRHLKAWKGFSTAVGRLPDGAYPDVEFMDSLYGLFRNDPNRGKVLGGDVVQAVKKLNTSHNELYAAAQAYGLAAEDR